MKKISILVAALTLSACSSIPVNVQRASVNTEYDFGEQMEAINKRIAIVDPEATFASPTLPSSNTQNPAVTAMMQYMDKHNGGAVSKNTEATSAVDSVKAEVKSAISSGIQTLITRRGFTYSGPYSSFDEITYSDKKSSYLAVLPQFKINVRKDNKDITNSTAFLEEKGNVAIDGEFVIKLVEPMTKQVIMQKRIDLSKLAISEPYIIQKENRTGQDDLLGAAIKQSTHSLCVCFRVIIY